MNNTIIKVEKGEKTLWTPSHHSKEYVIELLHLICIMCLVCLELETVGKIKGLMTQVNLVYCGSFYIVWFFIILLVLNVIYFGGCVLDASLICFFLHASVYILILQCVV